jgi:hypothetical protein
MIQLLVVIVVVGFLLYLVASLIPMDPRVKQILVAVVILLLVLYILQAFGVLGGPLPRLR